MGWIAGAVILALAAAALLVALRSLVAGVHPHPGQSLDGTRSIGDLIAEAEDRPVHIVFVHGIRALGPGTSAAFRAGLCERVGDGCRQEGEPLRLPIDLGARPPVRYMDEEVWTSDAAWSRSQPFVDRHVFRRTTGGPIVVDELNWWPLLFPLKCRYLLLPEADLSGPDLETLRRCVEAGFLTEAELQAALAGKPSRHAGGAKANRALKAALMNWGLSDAVIALGPLQGYVHETMNQAFAHAAEFGGTAAQGQTFVVVSESLGSFAVLDAFDGGQAPAVETVLTNTYHLYFFANQFRLLELARLKTASEALRTAKSARASTSGSPLQRWAQSRPASAAAFKSARPDGEPKQIIAFSDPSDILTFEVPEIEGARVVNLYDRNGFDLLGLLADPVAAHVGHSRNPAVLDVLFRRRSPRP